MSTKQTVEMYRETLVRIRRDLDACQRVIHLAGGFDPAYVEDAQARLKEIDEVMAATPCDHIWLVNSKTHRMTCANNCGEPHP